MAKHVNQPSSTSFYEPVTERKQTKQEIEKFRRDRMNVSMEELKGFLVRNLPNQTTKLEKADILEQTVKLVGKLIADKDRAFNDGVKRGMMDVCNILIKSGQPEAQKVAQDIMLSIRPSPSIQFPIPRPPMAPSMLPLGGPFGFMGFPGMGIPPPMVMQPHQHDAMRLPTLGVMPLQSMQTPTQATQNVEPQQVATPAVMQAEPHTSDEEIDIENVEDRHEQTFSNAVSTSAASRGIKRKYSSSDDSGISDPATTPKMPKLEMSQKKKVTNFRIDQFLVS